MKIMLGVSLILALHAAPAWAVLGEYESSVSLDQQYMRGEDRLTTGQGYKLHQITSPNGAVVSEYISPQGRVFAVSWRAPFIPNLGQLLGSYISQVQQAAQAQTRRRGGPLVVRANDFVFVSGGHMRAFHGSAYVPSLFPQNVSAEVVR
ncbi:MAG TPA: DUF2844 domain-containing protein [Terriglobia bacterium]|nr:DUF2844 domain-containing protein [Terriglobia bacterium]